MKNFLKWLFQATALPFLFVVIGLLIFYYPVEIYLGFLGNFIDESYVNLLGLPLLIGHIALLGGIYYLYIKFKK